jgi:hypothetical protein
MLGVCDGGHSAFVMRLELQIAHAAYHAAYVGIAAPRREDFDAETVDIRRSVVRGIVDVSKTLESVATLPEGQRSAISG